MRLIREYIQLEEVNWLRTESKVNISLYQPPKDFNCYITVVARNRAEIYLIDCFNIEVL